MNDYSIEFDEWLAFERQRSQAHGSKKFVGDRSYRHLDARIPQSTLESNEAFRLVETLKYPDKLKKHSFFPFLRKDKKVRRFTREYNGDGKKDSTVKTDQKLRPIMYASHKDASIYGFYAYMLKEKYDKLIADTPLDSSVIAYRRIPRDDGSGRNKSNVDFANDIYGAIKTFKNSAVLCVDIKGFFDNMQHDNIKQSWLEVLNESELPTGHEVVYRNITNFRYAFLVEVLQKMGEGKIFKGRFRYASKAKRRGMIGNPKLYNKLINNTDIIHKNRSIRGIPQGSPISDIIANMYLLNFDRKIIEFIQAKNAKSLYKRYSDDILIVCRQEDAVAVYDFIQTLMGDKSIDLNLSTKKTELFYVDTISETLEDKTSLIESEYHKNKKSIQYLGFEFDLKDINVRSGTIANHYRKVIRARKRANRQKAQSPKPRGANRKRLNRFQYFRQVVKKTDSFRAERQLKNIKRRTKAIVNDNLEL